MLPYNHAHLLMLTHCNTQPHIYTINTHCYRTQPYLHPSQHCKHTNLLPSTHCTTQPHIYTPITHCYHPHLLPLPNCHHTTTHTYCHHRTHNQAPTHTCRIIVAAISVPQLPNVMPPVLHESLVFRDS